MLSRCFQGFLSCLLYSLRRTIATRGRVDGNTITSSIMMVWCTTGQCPQMGRNRTIKEDPGPERGYRLNRHPRLAALQHRIYIGFT
jgi:hypothetical protein